MTLYDRNGCPTPVLANSDEYRENYDRIFGKKENGKKVKCTMCWGDFALNDAVEHSKACDTYTLVWHRCKPCEAKAKEMETIVAPT